MIKLTRINGDELYVSVHQIETAQAIPGTSVTLMSGRQLHVRESIDEVRAAMLAWHRAIMRGEQL